MSSTAIAPGVAAAIASTQSLCEGVRALNRRWADLKTVDDARLAYKAALATEDRAFEVLERDRTALELEQRRRRLAVTNAGRPAPPPPQPPPARTSRVAQPMRSEASPVERPAPPSADRRKLKKMFNRWQFTWEINPSIVAQINSIADNADRPLGEALALLDLRVFEIAIPNESDAERLARLEEWKGSLDAYADHVRVEIQRLENQHASVIAIWERWRRARTDATGLADWNLFIDKARAERQKRASDLSAEVQRMRTELGL